MPRFVAVLALAFTLVGCGNDGPTAPPAPTYPNLQGIYDISAPVNEAPGLRFSGSLTLFDDGTETPEFGGTFTLSLLANEDNLGVVTGEIVNAAVSESGGVAFDLEDDSWRFDGQLQGATLTGNWLLRGESNFTGTFTAVRR